MVAKTVVIANPTSGGGRGRRRLARSHPALRDALGDFELQRTKGPGDARELAAAATRAGAARIVAAGGDGTAGEVVSGILEASARHDLQRDRVVFGMLPLGSAQDALRNLGLPRSIEASLSALRAGATRDVDVGRVALTGSDGRPRHAYFLNDASFGVSAAVAEAVSESRRGGWLRHAPPRLAFALGAVRGAARFRPIGMELRVDDEALFRGASTFAVAANGRYFGGGMCVAPRAALDDGWLEMLAVPAMSKARLLRHLPTLYRGGILDVPGVVYRRGRRLQADPLDGDQVFVEVDGELVGRLPAEVRVEEGALRVAVVGG